MADPIVGIDLGTSNTVVAYADETGTVRVLADESGYKIHPSVVSFHPNGGVVVGAPAKQRKVIDPKNTIFSVKRLIGRGFKSKEVQTAKQRMPFPIKEGQNELPMVVTRGGEFAVPEISAIVLDHVRNVASTQLQTPVSRAVVTVPAAFNDAQRSATATAGAIAGLTIVRVLNEPTAAALAYGHTRNLHEIIAVYDFGGGTFDITILKLEDQVYEVLGTSGDTFLGGDDLDERLVDRMVEKFLTENRIDLRSNEVSMMRLRAVAEQTKIELSRRSRAVVRVDEIAYGAKGKPLDLQIEITRDEFVRQVADIIDRTFPVCQESLNLAGLGIDHINDVILVGGTTKIPYVRDQVSRFFGRAPRTDVNPEDAVAIGAALQATALERILKRKQPSQVSSVGRMPERDEPSYTDAEAIAPDTSFDDDSATMPAAEIPVPDLRDGPEEIELLPEGELFNDRGKKRDTGGYSQVAKTRTQPRPTERPPQRGEQVDRFAPPPTPTPTNAAPLARLTKFGMPAVAPPRGVDVPPDSPRPPARPPAVPPAGPQSKTMMIDPELVEQPTRVDPVPARAAAAAQPTLVVEPSPASTARGMAPSAQPSPPSTARAMAPTPQPSPASTARGMAPAPQPTSAAPGPGITARDLELEPDESLDFPLLPTTRVPGPADTAPGMGPAPARGFVAPQTFPVLEPPRSPVVMDVTPRGLGIATVAGFCEELIRRNSRLPAETRKVFTTSRDQQDAVRIRVSQGESRRLDQNVVLGDLLLENLPPRPRGETSIEVTFALDASGILQVRARDVQTGREQRATLNVIGTIPDADVEASREKMRQLNR